MIIPIAVNIEVPAANGDVNIVATILDFYYKGIMRITNTPDGQSMVTFMDGFHAKILVPFKEMYEIIDQQTSINKTYEDEVKEYLKDNWLIVKIKKKDNGEEGQHTI